MSNTTIALRSSGVASNTPSLGVITEGELSLNYADGILYYKTASNTLGSIRTTQPAGLTTEVQFNDSGSFGSNSAFTYNKTTSQINVTNMLVTSTLTTGSGAGGTIAGANVIYSNVFTANSTTTSTSNSTGAIISNGGIGVKGNVYADAVYSGNSLVWTASNDGAGSGLDADTLDGLHATAFANATFANTDYTTVSATAGTYGNASAIPVVTVEANGRVSSVTTQTFSAATVGDILALSIALG